MESLTSSFPFPFAIPSYRGATPPKHPLNSVFGISTSSHAVPPSRLSYIPFVPPSFGASAKYNFVAVVICTINVGPSNFNAPFSPQMIHWNMLGVAGAVIR